ncbi:GerA spore germination protein [Lentibacillus halodurans]|uniref:GerA spore germination protein n=1 Tax=Lentibacillus halodurans TaxID=237679 RepID=A0A1I0WBA8_9BACI|nr:spore germination protein [Lentibacillus halodurans]SFA85500.1 GerA spore germination protein [Lentibacillus halodurans]
MNKKVSRKKMQKEFEKLFKTLKTKDGFIHLKHEHEQGNVYIGYLKTAIDPNKLEKLIIPRVQEYIYNDLTELNAYIPFTKTELTDDSSQIHEKLVKGFLFIYMEHVSPAYLLIPLPLDEKREVSVPEVEFSVVGPKEAFVEDIDTNLNLIRKRLAIPELSVRKMKVGTITKTEVAVVSIDGIADKDNVETAIQRIRDVQIDQVIDSSFIQQTIADNENSPFPQLLDTERPDRIAAILAEGKIAIVVNGSPHVLLGPTTLIEFFSAFEDYFLNWMTASAFRLIRLIAVFFSILITPLYVAVLTHHFEIIPHALLGTLVQSRTEVPFPPLLEAFILEFAIELLREAGARLPTKIGQTIGIVGGIVIGTAAVEAGLTSNVLLIVVALAALGSFTTPVYKMSNTIRIIRFPLLIVAHVYGLIGMAIAIAYIMVHLLRLTSLGRPFFAPIFPFRPQDFKDAVIRLPFDIQNKRPFQVRPSKVNRPINDDQNKQGGRQWFQ